MDTFYIDKTTGTFADELLTAGFVRLLENLLFQQGASAPDIVQIDLGQYYRIDITPKLDIEQLSVEPKTIVLAPILRTAKNRKNLPNLPDDPFYVVDYEVEKEKRVAFFNAYSELEGTFKRAYAIGDDENFPFDSMPPPPHDRWNVFSLLNAPPMPINGYNKLMTQWLAVGEVGKIGEVYRLLCKLFGQSPNDLDTVIKNWKKLAKPYKWKRRATASQFFNPSQGKGVNRTLPNSVGLGNIKNFWLLEWLKAVGFYHIAFTGRVKNTDDRKTYVPASGHSSLQAREAVQTQFKRKMRFSETAVRSDILTIIRYVQAFMERVEAAQAEDASETEKDFLSLIGKVKRPSDFLRGFHAVYYKSLGTSAATMNIAFLNLPGWIEISQPEDVIIFQEILREHTDIVRQFSENKGEEVNLLNSYRDFIVADNLDPFFTFTNAYSSYIISQREKRGGYARQFETNNLRRLIVSNKSEYSAILDNPGFQNIAYAIRQSTVTAQWRKGEGDRRYDVRYGLGQELTRKSQYEDEFIAALSDFLHKYNAESAQVMENRPGPYRRSIRTDDIEEIVKLIDKHDADLICKLLVAYGYARESRPAPESAEESVSGDR